MRNLLLLFTVFILSEVAWGQTELTGHLTSSGKNINSGVNILVHPLKKPQKIIAFAFLESNGNFKITFKCDDDSIGITTKSLNYKDSTLHLCNRNQHLTIDLPVFVHELKEVRVKGQAIIARKDTLKYMVNSFAAKKDQSIGDVIRKMPGFEVNEDGKILYQGVPIQKYYVEGMDLMENRYSIVNKNLPYRDVGSVEVLLKHQPIKVLKSNTFSEGTSLNLKLKKNVSITGTANAGGGLPWLLHKVNISPMVFSPRQQAVVSLQANNSGEDLNSQNQPLTISNGRIEMGTNTHLLRISSISKPSIDQQRYLNNNAYLASYNHLIKVNTQTELKVNTSFYQDHQKEAGEKISSYFLTGQNYTLQEVARNHYYNTKFSTNLDLTQNVDKRYLKEQLQFSHSWDYENGEIANILTQKQKAETPATQITSNFDLILPVKKDLIRITSQINYIHMPQNMIFSPGILSSVFNDNSNYNETGQFFSHEKLTGDQSLCFTINKKAWHGDSECGLKFNFQHQQTYIQKDGVILNADSLNNKINWNSYELYFREALRYESEKLKVRIEFPVSNVTYQQKDQIAMISEWKDKLLFSPRASLSYFFNGFWHSSLSLGRSSDLGSASQLLPGYTITGNRNLQCQSDKLNNSTKYNFITSLNYKNPISGFFSSWSWMHSEKTNALLYRNIVTGTGSCFYEAVERNNKSTSNNFYSENSWFLSNQKITLGLKGIYNQSKREYLLNDSRGWVHSNLWNIEPSININRWQKVGIDYSGNLNFYNQRNLQTANTTFNQSHKISLSYYANSTFWIEGNQEFYQVSLKDQKDSNHFFTNFSFNYTPRDSRIQYKFKCSNLFNVTQIRSFSYSDIAMFENSYIIRGREFMISVYFPLNKFKKQN